MPGWLESAIVIPLGAAAIVFVVKYSEAIAALAMDCLGALGVPLDVIIAWKRRSDSESRISHQS